VVGTDRSPAQQQVAELLHTARQALDLGLAFLARLDERQQTLEVIDAEDGASLPEGFTHPADESFCRLILAGRLPCVVPDLHAFPEAAALPAVRELGLRSFVSVPVTLSDGRLYGTFCAAGRSAESRLSTRDETLMRVLAQAAAVLIEPEFAESERVAAIRRRLDPLMAAGGPAVVLQPIVELGSARRIGAEALSRFPDRWELPPDVVFEQAHSIGEGVRLELLALERAATLLAAVPGYIALNVSPGTVLDPACLALLGRLPAQRLVVELSEHDRVDDYAALAAALAPLREHGARLAIDDVGAGFSSLRHIVLTAPDIIKIDRSIAGGAAGDPVLRTLVRALVQFAAGLGADVVAEGVETAEDADQLRALGVGYGQGWYFGRPGPAHDLAPCRIESVDRSRADSSTIFA